MAIDLGKMQSTVRSIHVFLIIIYSKKYHGYLLENRLRFRIHGALQDLECNKYNVPRFVSGDAETDGGKQVGCLSPLNSSFQESTQDNIINTQSSTVEIKRFKETSV